MMPEDKQPLRVSVSEWDQAMIAQASAGYMANMLFNLRLVALQHADEAIRAQAMALLDALHPHNVDLIALNDAVVRHAERTAEEETVEQNDDARG